MWRIVVLQTSEGCVRQEVSVEPAFGSGRCPCPSTWEDSDTARGERTLTWGQCSGVTPERFWLAYTHR